MSLGLGSKMRTQYQSSLKGPYDRERLPADGISHERELIGLEKTCRNVCFKVSREKCNFPHFFAPNETCPVDVVPHCQFLEEGVAVATGCERIFFLLSQLDPQRCYGLVSRDINPDVKAYIDFNVLLIRLSSKSEDYVKLSEKPTDLTAFEERMDEISAMLKTARMPDKTKRYYEKHLHEFGYIYLNTPREWRFQSSFDGCNYYKCDALFRKIKGFADAGDIVSTTGPINDLTFLNGKSVSIIDTSNILAYSFLNLKVAGFPRVIWTWSSNNQEQWHYMSYTHQPLSPEECAEFEETLSVIKSCCRFNETPPHQDPHATSLLVEFAEHPGNRLGEASLGPIYSPKTLQHLRSYREKNILSCPRLGHIPLATQMRMLNQLTSAEIKEVCSKKHSKEFISTIIEKWRCLNASTCLAFSQLEGWHDVFEEHFSVSGGELDLFLAKVRASYLYEKFETIFGKERLNQLIAKLTQTATTYLPFTQRFVVGSDFY